MMKKKESSTPERSKRQKKEEHEYSGRTVTLTNKRRMVSRYNKASVGKIVYSLLILKLKIEWKIACLFLNSSNYDIII